MTTAVRGSRAHGCILLTLMVLLLCGRADACEISFVKIADTAGQEAAQIGDLRFITGAASIRGREVAFAGVPTGLYAGRGRGVRTLVLGNEIDVGAFAGIENIGLAVYDRGATCFWGSAFPHVGLFRRMASGTEIIADDSTAVPDSDQRFTFFHYPACRGAHTAFVAAHGDQGEEGVYAASGGGPIRRIADTSMRMPGFSVPFRYFDEIPAIGGNMVVFAGSNYVEEPGGAALFVSGIYAGDGRRPLRTLITSKARIPGSDEGFWGFSTPVVDGPKLAFRGFATSCCMPGGEPFGTERGLYLLSPGRLEIVADLATAIPGGLGSFTGFGNFDGVSLSRGLVAFYGTGSDGQEGIYLRVCRRVVKVADRADRLDGKAIRHFGTESPFGFSDALGRDALNLWSPQRASVAFRAQLEDGSEGIWRADISVPPAACIDSPPGQP